MRRGIKSRRMHAVCARAWAATENAAESNSLRSRTASALDFLLRYKQLSYILEAVITLGERNLLTMLATYMTARLSCESLIMTS